MSVVGAFINSKEFSKLLIKGKDQNYLTPEEINDAIPASIGDCRTFICVPTLPRPHITGRGSWIGKNSAHQNTFRCHGPFF